MVRKYDKKRLKTSIFQKLLKIKNRRKYYIYSDLLIYFD